MTTLWPPSRALVAEVRSGTRTINGTEFPVTSQVHRIAGGSRVEWLATYNLCNGVPAGAETFRTRREAMEAIGA